MPYNETRTDTAKPDMKLFYACFVALVTTSFGFILRALILPQWGREFNLSQTQLGEIAGVGLWPFAISIVLFSLVIDKIGLIMLVSYLMLIFYFRSKGGYRAVDLKNELP